MKYITILIFLISTNNVLSQTISGFEIKGNKKLKSSFVKKISQINIGAALDSLKLEEDVKLLKRLSSVANASYEVSTLEDANYKVVYTVKENLTIIPSINFYVSNDDEFAYRLGLYEFNLLGRSMTLGGFYQKDIYKSFGVNFRAPFLFSPKLGLALNHQDINTLEPVFFNNTTSDYKYRNKSYEVLGLYQHNFNSRFELGVNYFLEEYSYVAGATSSDVPLRLSVDKMLYKGVFEYDTIDYEYQYLSGFRSVLNLQYITSTSEELPEFIIAWNDFNYFKRVGEKGNWANRLRLGFSSNDSSPFAPFSIDNNLNIRGVGNTIDRGTGIVILNTEYRHTLYEKGWFVLQGNAFLDVGSWRNPGGDFGYFGEADNFRMFPGLGLRFMHKSIFNAIFRIDYGYGISKEDGRGLVFGIGQYF